MNRKIDEFDIHALTLQELPPIEHGFVTVEVDSDRLEGRQTVPVSFVSGNGKRKNELMVLHTPCFDGPHTGMQTIRTQLLAMASSLDTVCIGMPGMAPVETMAGMSRDERAGYRLTEKQTEELKEKGHFTEVGRSIFSALRHIQASRELGARALHFANMSMGNSLTAGVLASVPEELGRSGVIASIINIEAAALIPDRPLGDLAQAFTHKDEQKINKKYEQELNPNWVPLTTDLAGLSRLVRGIMKRSGVVLAAGKGMAKGAMMEQLTHGLHELDVPVEDVNLLFVNGEHSRVSPTAVNENAAKQLSAGHDVWKDGYHSTQNHLGEFVPRVTSYLG